MAALSVNKLLAETTLEEKVVPHSMDSTMCTEICK